MQFKIFDLGLVDFKIAEQLQEKIFFAVKDGALKSGLIFCQHNPVITLGRLANQNNLLASELELRIKGIKVYSTPRGGDVTYHGPGQIMVYPVFNLNYLKKDVHWFLRQLEEVAIACLLNLGIKAQRRLGLTGVWIEGRKIASIGIAIKNWITFYGLSMNIKKDDLDNFGLIRPCGLDIKMASLETVLGKRIEINEIKEGLICKFRSSFCFS